MAFKSVPFLVEGVSESDLLTPTCTGETKYIIKEFCTNPSGREALDVFITELKRWLSLFAADDGEHVLPCWGICIGSNNNIGFIYPRPAQGNIIEYLKRHPRADRIAMIKHIAIGLKIMHEHDTQIIHGDLRAANIAINDQGKPVMTNLAFSANIYNVLNVKSNTPEESLNATPEALEENAWAPTSGSDVYALAMTALEIFTEELAFTLAADGSKKSIKGALSDLHRRKLPERPVGNVYMGRGLDDRMWALLRWCWAADPRGRPSIDDIILELSQAQA